MTEGSSQDHGHKKLKIIDAGCYTLLRTAWWAGWSRSLHLQNWARRLSPSLIRFKTARTKHHKIKTKDTKKKKKELKQEKPPHKHTYE
jgi:hypothetical protein